MTSSYSSKSYKPIRRIDVWRKWILAGVALLVSVAAIDLLLAYFGVAMQLTGRGEAVFLVCLAGLVVVFFLRMLAREAFQRYSWLAYPALMILLYLISVALIYLATNLLRDFGPALVSYLSPMIWLQGSVATKVDLLLQSGASWGATLDNFFPHSLLVGSMLWLGAFSFLLVWHGAAHLARKYGHTIYYLIVTLLLSLFLAELSAFYFRIDSGYPTFVIISFLLIFLLVALLYKRASELRERYPWSVIPAGFITFFMLLQGIISAQVNTLNDPLGNALAPVAMALRRYWAAINDALALSPQLTLGGEFKAFLPYALLWGLLAWALAFCAVLTVQGMRKDLLTGLLRRWRWVAGFFALLMALSIPAYLQFSLAPAPDPERVRLPALPDLHKAQPQDLIEFEDALWGAYSDGVYRFDDENEIWEKVSEGLLHKVYSGQFYLQRDSLWLGIGSSIYGESGIFQFDAKQQLWESRNDNLPNTFQVDDFTEFDDTLWVGLGSPDGNNVYRYDVRNKTWVMQDGGLSDRRSFSPFIVHENRLWKGYHAWDSENGYWLDISAGLPGESYAVDVIEHFDQMVIVLGGGKGVYRYHAGLAEWQNFGYGLGDTYFLGEFFVSNADDLWFMTLGNGVFRLNSATESWETSSFGWASDIFETGDSRLWLDAGENLYFLSGEWKSYGAGMPSGEFFYERQNGELWNGHYRLNSDTHIWESMNGGLQLNISTPVMLEGNGDLWISFYPKGIYRRSTDEIIWQAANTGLPAAARISDISVAGNNSLWALDTNLGPYRYYPELEAWESVPGGLSSADKFIIHSDGTLWVYSVSAVHHLDNFSDVWVNRSIGLPPNVGANEFLSTRSGELWLIDSEAGKVYRYGETGGWQPMAIGLPEDAVVTSIVETETGEVWIAVFNDRAYQFDRKNQNWQPVTDRMEDDSTIVNLAKTTDNRLWAAFTNWKIYTFIPGIDAWSTTEFPENLDIARIQAFGGRIYAFSDDGVFRYDDIGRNGEAFSDGLPENISTLARFYEINNTLWLGSDFGIYRLDLESETWLPENNFVDLPVCVARDNEGMLVVDYRHEHLRRFSPNVDEPVWQPSDFEMIDCDAVFLQAETQIGLPSTTRRLVTNYLAEDTLGLRYAEGYLWVSPEEFSWNPVAKLDVIPLGAEIDLVNRQATLWTRSESANAIDAYTIPLPLQTRWDFSSFLFALGRDPQYWYLIGALALVYLGYLAVIYAIAGQSNGIAARQFFTLKWETPDLLGSLLSRGEQSYTALRLRLQELAPLPHLICVLRPVGEAFADGDVVRDLQSRDLPLGKAAVNAALEMLVSRGILRGKQGEYEFGSPQLLFVYQRTYPPAALDEALEAARVRDPAFAEAIRFFERAGFLIDKQAGSNLMLLPQSQIQRERLGERVLARMLPGQALKASTVRRVADAVSSLFKEDADPLRGRKALVVIGESADMAASAQMYAYRWDAGFTVVPLTRARIRTALTADTCHQEFDAVLSEYLAESPDLYDHKFPVRDEHYFGRVRDTETLLVYLNENQPLGIFAINKMGKTSFVNNLAERLADRAVARVDLQNLSKNAQAVFAAVIRSLINDIETKWPDAEIPPLCLTSALRGTGDWAQDFSSDMNTLYELLRSHAPNPRFVIFVDEIDRLIPGEDVDLVAGFAGYNDLLATLRGIQQLGLPLTFVAVGISPNINRKAQFAGLENAGFNLFKEYFLPPLSREECDQMVITIGHQMGLEFNPEALTQIFVESAGHPFLARQLCSALWSSLRGERNAGEKLTVGLPESAEAVNAYMDDDGKRSYHDQIWATRLTADEQQVVERLAAADEPRPLLRGEQKPLRSLLQRHIVIEKGQRYEIAFGLLRRWVRDEILEIYED